jgi:hypothetical protein
MASKKPAAALPPLSGSESEDKARRPVGIPGGTQHTRTDGIEDRDWKNVDGSTVYRTTQPIANPQEQAAKKA